MSDENDENIQVSWNSYKTLYAKYYGFSFLFLGQFFMIAFMGSKLANDYIVGKWA